MNKQELIDKLASLVGSIEDFKGISTFHDGKYAGLEHALELIKQLDEPQKPVVPKFVAEWFEQHKDQLGYSIWELVGESHKSYTTNKSDMRYWVCQEPNEPFETLVRMKNGYEVEKEQLYRVIMPNPQSKNGNVLVLRRTQQGTITVNKVKKITARLGEGMDLTEEEIKSVDERYWPFAVPVEEVAEG
ncbi:hypothetical protein CUT02_03015 [Enterococcus faecium]|uniref:DUF1642 domain-containing protein n=1 Tax=Enterococcus faecium TaxID=1352 RepID=UPI000CF2226E|nr:DUF1642 domain-containing protein [Enterococcus faecium]PQF37932.1 hypothetical protein CUT02_03015 [Enterococcus faecium]PQF63712.1 hypothetical protein CUS78_08375 [Enterococcus faecium]